MLRHTRTFAFAIAAVVAAAFSVPIHAQWKSGSGGTIYYNGGNVGIGTTSPATSLQVKGSGLTVGATYEDGDTANYGLIVQTNQASGNYAYLGLLRGGNAGMFLTQISSQFVIGPNVNGTSPYVTINNAASNLGAVGIGTTDPCTNAQAPSNCKLSVAGAIQAYDVTVNNSWSDYVFDPGYHLAPLGEVANYIRDHHHLPDIPSAEEVQEKGVSVGDMEAKLLAKIEELTLHMIEAEKENRELRERITRLEARDSR